MKFATLGCDETIFAIARWIRRETGHDLVAVFDAGLGSEELLRLFPRAKTNEGWESLLAGREVGAVIVSSRPVDSESREIRAEQLRKLVQESVPLLLIHPVCEAIEAIELEMIRRDTQGVLLPFIPELGHPAFRKMLITVSDPNIELGRIEQIVAERSIADRTDSRVISSRFACDMALMSRLLGDVRQVSAMSGSGDEPDFANLSVSMRSAGSIIGRWTVGPVEDSPKLRLAVLGTNGRVTLEIPAGGARCRLTVLGQPEDCAEYSFDQAIQAAVDEIQNQTMRGKGDESWNLACRALEAADAVTQSCRRGRSIEMLGEQPTEEDTFKALMAAGGCGMLVWVLFVLLVDSLFLPAAYRTVWWTMFALVPLLCFLSLQLLKLLFRKSQ